MTTHKEPCPYLKVRGGEYGEEWYYCELKESYCTVEYDWDIKCEVYEKWKEAVCVEHQ